MKLQIDLSQWPKLDLDLNPDDMAAVIRALMQSANQMAGPAAFSVPQKQVQDVADQGDVRRATAEQPLPKPNPVPKKAAKQAQIHPIQHNKAANGESHKRRDQVRAAFIELKKQGTLEVNLKQVKAYFKQHHPEEDLKNLDQVVRDLSNKGEELESVRRGVYRLVAS